MTGPAAGGASAPVLIVLPDPLVWIPLSFPAASPGVHPLTGGRCLLGGWSLGNPGAAAAGLARIWDVSGVFGQQFASVPLGIDGTSNPDMPYPGVYCPNGLSIQTNQNIEGVVFYAPLD